MIGAFVMLFVGGALVGGAYSFFRSKKPWWSVAALGVIGVICLGLSFWTLQNL
ncbi:hypothetical protein [Brachybacterium massiliense]|uniref:hypothetical protein n=1 Tax=Brachybacterium massiliense TaxID=1755098 RepID=UPI000B3BB126|nr:hypothetical protein [Brachybacterium massiliense]